ncbi:MYND-type domain-containing protein [Caerostris darwini]|uniref:MYND-type domain-containing protein n=1 Tax=Caerostris darwini TaxID=1538125 RepID=A0AAV4QLI9_9ARAC|nr:MYND-type domain-containing protein [Caerostris darwini]
MNEPVYKRVAFSSLSQHVGKPVTVLGEFDQLEPNGKKFTMKVSSNHIVTIQLQEPMRALKLRHDDGELFDENLDTEKFAFLNSHLPAFKRMWTEEGKVYWLRFLLTFRDHVDSTCYHHDTNNKLWSFVFIYIHRQFVEGTYSTVKHFMDNIFIAAKHFHNLPEQSFTKNPFYTKESREAFRALLGKPDLEDEIPVPLMGFVCTIYFEFISALICLLKKWVHEPDLSEEDLNKIDYTAFYWKPRNHWEEPNFVPTCFDKYLATYWKDDLPKMLLTCDIHNTFNNHEIHNCCDYAQDMNIFELFRDKIIMTPQFVIQHCSLIQPISESCTVHTDCRAKIIHSSECAEPYLCEGSKTCSITCEKSSVKQQNFSKIDETNPWKNISVEIFTCGGSNKRSVSTLAQSQFDVVETFAHGEDNACDVHECHEDFFCAYHSADLRNAYNQHKRKEQLKKRLRSKLNRRYFFDPKDYEDSEYCWSLYEHAHQMWLQDMCEDSFKELMNSSKHKKNPNNELSLKKVQRLLASVAVSTEDFVFGRVVAPGSYIGRRTTAENSATSSPVCEEMDLKPKLKKSKSKKKKNNASSSLNEKNDKELVNELINKHGLLSVKVNTKDKIKDCKCFDNPQKSEAFNEMLSSCKSGKCKGSALVMVRHEVKTVKKAQLSSIAKTCESITKDIWATRKKHCKEHVKCVKPTSCFFCNTKCPETNDDSNNVKEKSSKYNINETAKENCESCNSKSMKESLEIGSSNKNIKGSCKTSSNKRCVKDYFHTDNENNKKTCKLCNNKSVEENGTSFDKNINFSEGCDSTSAVKSSENSKKGMDITSASFVNGVKDSNTAIDFQQEINAKHVNPSAESSAVASQLLQNQDKVKICKMSTSNVNNDQLESESTVDKFFTLIGVSNVKSSQELSRSEIKQSLHNGVSKDSEDQASDDFSTYVNIIQKSLNSINNSNNKDSIGISIEKKLKLKTCAFCRKKEVQPKTFKRCGRCKIEKFEQQRYYCTRTCQLEDWEESHRDEHSKKAEIL